MQYVTQYDPTDPGYSLSPSGGFVINLGYGQSPGRGTQVGGTVATGQAATAQSIFGGGNMLILIALGLAVLVIATR